MLIRSVTALPGIMVLCAVLSVTACTDIFSEKKVRQYVGAPVTTGHGRTNTCSGVAAATALPPLHRLTHSEYDLTVRDLLGTSQSFASSLPSEQSEGGFNTAAEAQVITPTTAQGYFDSANKLAAEYLKRIGQQCAANDSACFDSTLLNLGERAFRRPLSKAEADRLKALPETLRRDGASAPESFSSGLSAILLSPQFLFRINTETEATRNLQQFTLASRLSYFIWSTLPDATLLGLAQSGGLSNQDTLRQTVQTMLSDQRAIAFVKNFGSQWLGTTNLAKHQSSAAMDAATLADFEQETLHYLGEFVRQNINVRDLLDAKFTFVNSRLARYYGLPAAGDSFVKTELTGSRRGGLLTQGSFLVSTSNPETTSPVKRGQWILNNILCSPPPPPPQGVDSAGFDAPDPRLSMRERVARHSSNPTCASCHMAMDPLGLAFENFDAFAVWRAADGAGPIDSSGQLPNGISFATSEELIAQLRSSDQFPRCVAMKMATYALGRAPQGRELCVIDQIAGKAGVPGYGMQDMIIDIGVDLLAQ